MKRPIFLILAPLLLIGALCFGWYKGFGLRRGTGVSTVQITFSENTTSTPQSIVGLIDNDGNTVLVSSGQKDAAPSQFAKPPSLSSRLLPKTSASTPASKATRWTSSESAEAHWQKHRAEFPEYRTVEQYVAAADAMVTHPPPATLTKVSADGDRLFFNPRDGTFAVLSSEGTIRTMFRPRNGMDYWRRQ